MNPNYIVRKHKIPCQHIRGYYRSTANSQEEELHLAVKQYIPASNQHPRSGDVTIIAAHCAGMFKELYEPVFEALISASEQLSSKYRIRSIWIADVATHGESHQLNNGKLGIDLSWDDHARDLLHMTNVLKHEMVRPIVGLGHSAGGTMILRLAAMHPRLFASLLLVEPAVSKEFTAAMNYAPTYFLSKQQSEWTCREEAFAKTKNVGAQRYWHPATLQRWHDHGFQDTETGTVTLSTPKQHSVRAYARAVHPAPGEPLLSLSIEKRTHPDISHDDLARLKQPAYAPTSVAAYRDLPHILPSVLFIYGDRITTAASRLDNRATMIPLVGRGQGGSGGQLAGKVKEVIIPESGHFVPFEKPGDVAQHCNEWLQAQLTCWMEEERINDEEWQCHGTSQEKAILDDGWMWWAAETYGKKAKI